LQLPDPSVIITFAMDTAAMETVLVNFIQV